MENCKLCFNVTFKKNLFSLDDEQDCGETIKSLIEKHFWFSDKILEATKNDEGKCVCKTCWQKLEDFHELFSNVKHNYKIVETTSGAKVEHLDDQFTIVERLDEDGCSNDENDIIETTVEETNSKVPDIWDNVANKRKYGQYVDIIEKFTEAPKKKLKQGEKPKTVEKYRFLCRICKRVNTGFVGTTGPIRSHLRRIHDFNLQELDAALCLGDFESRVYVRKKKPPIDSDTAPSEDGDGQIEALEDVET